ncbi:GTP-binding protein [Trichinella spiralis]|uniref:GTP-binding protein n=1 Tax=Trichinella spiralis TaxID=6334 RepID=A0ABR3KIY0_TRISP
MLDEIGSDKPPRYEDFKRKSSEEQNCPKSTRTELLNLGQSQFGAIRRMYHELREKEAALQNVEDPHMRADPFSLTPNVIGTEFSNCSTESLLAHASRYLQTRFV